MKFLVSLFTLLILLCSCESDEKLTFETESFTNDSCEGCAVITIELPRTTQNKKIGRTINNSLNEEIITLLTFEEGKSVSTIDEAVSSFENGYKDLRQMFPEESVPWEADIKAVIIYETTSLLSISLHSYIYTGGAHGYGATHFLNFNKRNGKELERNEIFKNREGFEDFAEEKFRIQESIPSNDPINSTGFMFEQEEFYLPENIGFTADGLKLLYNPYEVASYADGVIELVLPYEDIQEYLAF